MRNQNFQEPRGRGLGRGFGQGKGQGMNRRNTDTPYGVPKRDGSGQGVRANMGRGGCLNPQNQNR